MCFLWPASGTRNHRNRTIAGFVSSCLSLRSFSTSAGHTVNLVSPSTACELRCRSGLTTASVNAARCIVLLKASSFSVVFSVFCLLHLKQYTIVGLFTALAMVYTLDKSLGFQPLISEQPKNTWYWTLGGFGIRTRDILAVRHTMYLLILLLIWVNVMWSWSWPLTKQWTSCLILFTWLNTLVKWFRANCALALHWGNKHRHGENM